MSQEIITINISELHLWTENPRDPITFAMSDKDIILRAITQKDNKWDLAKLVKQMGIYYDISELPTIVRKNDKYVVYDGNRRLAIIKYCQNPSWSSEIEKKLFPTDLPQSFQNMREIPCNLCDENTALTNIERKHINSGTWGDLEKSYFLHVHRGKPKDSFMIIEESTGGIISSNPKVMNRRFVGEEILTNENLRKIGFAIENEELVTIYDTEKAKLVLDKIVELINKKEISTRKNRGELLKPLAEHYPELQLEEYNKEKTRNIVSEMHLSYGDGHTGKQRLTKRTDRKNPDIFGKSLILKKSETNDIYRDIELLYDFYSKNKDTLSSSFPSLIRMALRLLVESATLNSTSIDHYIEEYFQKAKKNLNTDQKTTLSNYNVRKEKMKQLLHTGAHHYTASSNLEQTLAMSLIIGAMLQLSHPRE